MHPSHHETALAAFFRRHGLVAPHTECDGLIERHGLVLAMAFAMRDAGFRAQPAEGDACAFGSRTFPLADWLAAGGEAHRLAHIIGETATARAPDMGHLVDRMALDMRRLDLAGIPVTADVMAREGYTAEEIVEAGVTAAQLAEAMKVAQRGYWKARQPKATPVAEREAA